jgi:ankyrin repeat protein
MNVVEHLVRFKNVDVNNRGDAKHYYIINRKLSSVDSSGLTALMIACKDGSMGLVTFLVEHGAEVNARGKSLFNTASQALYMFLGWRGQTALMHASMGRRLDALRLLIEFKADINAKGRFIPVKMSHTNLRADEDGRTALDHAAKNGYPDIVSFLVQIQIDSNDDGESNGLGILCSSYNRFLVLTLRTALLLSLKHEHLDVATILIEHETKFSRSKLYTYYRLIVRSNFCGGWCGAKALIHAAKARRLDILTFLMENGGDINVQGTLF